MKHKIFLMLGCCFLVIHPQAQSTLQTGLVAYYPLDGDILDYSGNDNHGTFNSGAVPTVDRMGTPDGAYLFDGIDDYIFVVSNQNFEPQMPVTIAAWILPTDQSNLLRPIFTNDDSEDIYYGFSLLKSTTDLLAANYFDGGLPGPAARRTRIGTTDLVSAQWYHVAAVIRDINDVTLYVDGKEECGSFSGTGGALQYPSKPKGGTIGRDDANLGSGNTSYFQGAIDELRFYDRALTEEEIRQLAEAPMQTNTITICANETAILNAGGSGDYTWSPAVGLSCTNCNLPLADPDVTTTYTAIRQANSGGCPDTVTWMVNVDSCTQCKTGIDFGIFPNGSDYSFVPSVSVNIDVNTIRWDFGDGNNQLLLPSVAATHTYTSPGTYQVCAIANVGDGDGIDACKDTICKTVTVTATALETEVGLQVKIFPNPVRDQLTIELEEGQWQEVQVRVTDIRGRLIHQFHPVQAASILATDSWAEGIYIVKLQSQDIQSHYKVMKE
ncbi:MAG: LamG-like jellyroll fold domain-containing protein [Bacteroidota bacterium]